MVLGLGAVLLSPVASAASALPDGRAYEQVSPAEKSGGDAFPGTAFLGLPYGSTRFPSIAASNGEMMLFASDSPFAGATIGGENAYLARRTPGGWTTQAIAPPSEIAHPGPSYGTPGSIDATTDLSTIIFSATYNDPFSSAPLVPDSDVLLARSANGTNTQVDLGAFGGPGNAPGATNSVAYGGMSADGSHVVFDSNVALQPPVSPSEEIDHLYVRNRLTNTTSVVDILPNNSLSTRPAWLGPMAGYGGANQETNMVRDAVSLNGSRIFWATESAPQPRPLYARVDESRTVLISASQCSGSCATPTRGAQFQDANAEGSQVFFISDGQLTDGAPNERNLYRFTFNATATGGTLTLISPQGLSSTTATGLVGASQDGKVAYFVSNNPYNGMGVAGALNLYVNDHGGVSFIGTLSGEDEKKDLLIDQPYENGDEAAVQARVTPDGQHLVFQSFAQLTSYENAGHSEIYEFDLQSKSLMCLSCGASPATGNGELTYPELTAAMVLPHNLSDDGTRVFFETEESLVSQDTNGTTDVYEWNEGAVSLISGGSGPMPSYFIGATDSGRDAFFATYDQLALSDTDTSYDIYDARVGGGFPVAGSAPECAGGECRSTSSAPVFAAPASAGVSGLGNAPSPGSPTTKARARSGHASSTRAVKLARALAKCDRRPKRKRVACVKRARSRLARSLHTTKSAGRAK